MLKSYVTKTTEYITSTVETTYSYISINVFSCEVVSMNFTSPVFSLVGKGWYINSIPLAPCRYEWKKLRAFYGSEHLDDVCLRYI